jgi:hypothetical protein
MVARPAYAPALVVFMGSGSQFSFSVGSGPAVGWYPLAPGEAWWPAYRTSPRYVSFVNYSINLNNYPRNYDHHVWRQRPFAATAVSEDDFRHGRPVYRHWQAVSPQAIGRVQVGVVPGGPQTRQPREATYGPRLLSQPPASVQPGGTPQRFWSGRAQAPAVQEQFRAQRDQDRVQRGAEQVRQQEQQRQPQDPRTPRENFQQRQPQDQRVQQEAWQRRQQEQAIRQQQDQRAQREARQQRPQQEQVQRQQEHAQRQQQEQAQRQQEQIQRQQQHAQRQQQEQARREGWQREREPQGLQRVPQQAVQEVVRQQQQQLQQQQPQGSRGPEGRGEGRGHREGGGEGRGRGSRD